MVSGASDLVDIDAEFRKETAGGAYMIFCGKYDDDNREIWVSLPKACTEWDGRNLFTIPRRMAVEKGIEDCVV